MAIRRIEVREKVMARYDFVFKHYRVGRLIEAQPFEFEGEVYKTISAVAKAITGSHTSGFLFFRLNGKGVAR